MDYKCVPFEPFIDRKNAVTGVASSLDGVITTEAKDGWEFVGLENHSTIVPGSNGCFGFGATNPFEKTFSIAVFRK